MSFTPPAGQPRSKIEADKARAEERRIRALGHAEAHRALGRDLGPKRGRRLWRRFLGVLTGTQDSDW